MQFGQHYFGSGFPARPRFEGGSDMGGPGRMDHGAIAQDREVEAVAIESHELRAQLSDLADEG
jgi:hypothetical protein